MDTKIKKILKKYEGMKFTVYGAGYFGAIVQRQLLEYGIKIEAFIDMYSFKPKYFNVPIIRCEGMAEWKNPQDYVVIVSIADESEHEWINTIIQKYNVGHVIYKHNEIIREEILDDHYLYESLTERGRFEQFRYCDGYDETYVLEINTLFMPNGKLLILDNEYLPFFDFFEGRKTMVGEFDLQDPKKYREANSIYRMINNVWEDGLTKEYYPIVCYDETSKHYVVIGNHEVALFQIAKNYAHIKCSMKAENANKPTIEQKDQLYFLIFDNDITHLYTPIPVADFYKIPSKREMGGIIRARELSSWIVRNNIKVQGTKVLDAGAYLGFFAQLFSNMGASTVTVERNISNCNISNIINNIIGSDVEIRHCSIEDIPESESYDISILLSVLYWHLGTELGLKIMEKINKVTTKYLFWESGDRIEFEKNFIFEHSDLKKYTRICNTYGNGKLRELGVFEK